MTRQMMIAARKLLVKISEMIRISAAPSIRLCSTVCTVLSTKTLRS